MKELLKFYEFQERMNSSIARHTKETIHLIIESEQLIKDTVDIDIKKMYGNINDISKTKEELQSNLESFELAARSAKLQKKALINSDKSRINNISDN